VKQNSVIPEAMKRLSPFVLIFLLVNVGTLSIAADTEAERIPLRNPEAGESRPGWWLDCWAGNVVVVEGAIEYKNAQASQIKIEISGAALKKHYERQEDRDLQRKFSLFYIGDLTVDKVLFAAPGIDYMDSRVASMISGRRRKGKVLLPTLAFPVYGRIVRSLRPGEPNTGVFVFHYGSSVLSFPMVYEEIIPPEEMKNALRVFAYRENFDHIKHSAGMLYR
jgi:hypothetical protein